MGEELYDIKADPGQQQDVAPSHPQVVKRLRDFYDSWWAELEPTFDRDARIYLGHETDNPTTLTSHDWITTGYPPWNQSQIREALTGAGRTGHWNVHVAHEGDYEFRLRRWPAEADTPITAGLDPGAPVPGEPAFRTTPGKALAIVQAKLEIAGQEVEKSVAPGAKEAVFNLKLSPGPATVTARFNHRGRPSLRGILRVGEEAVKPVRSNAKTALAAGCHPAFPMNWTGRETLSRDHNVQPGRNSRLSSAVASGELVTRRLSASQSSLAPERWATAPRLTASERGPE